MAAINARVEPKGNAILVNRETSGSARIHPLMAAFNAIAWMAANPSTGAAEHILDTGCVLDKWSRRVGLARCLLEP